MFMVKLTENQPVCFFFYSVRPYKSWDFLKAVVNQKSEKRRTPIIPDSIYYSTAQTIDLD